jgi:agmatinase
MHQLTHHHFADAETPYEDAQYVIFGVPYDGTTSFRPGTRFGPRAIREVSYNFESYEPGTGIDLSEVPFIDIGDIEPARQPELVVDQVREVVADLIRDGKVPIMLGGEHSATIGAVEALAPDCYVVCDAHLDLRDELYQTRYSHGCVTRRIYDAGVHEVFIIGARSGCAEQYAFADRVTLYTPDDVRSRGIAAVLDEVSLTVAGRRTYLSIDADAIDCCLTPGVGTPEPFGLTPYDIRDVVRTFAPQVVGFDYVEVCPIDAGQTAAVATQLIREFIAYRWRHDRPGQT